MRSHSVTPENQNPNLKLFIQGSRQTFNNKSPIRNSSQNDDNSTQNNISPRSSQQQNSGNISFIYPSKQMKNDVNELESALFGGQKSGQVSVDAKCRNDYQGKSVVSEESVKLQLSQLVMQKKAKKITVVVEKPMITDPPKNSILSGKPISQRINLSGINLGLVDNHENYEQYKIKDSSQNQFIEQEDFDEIDGRQFQISKRSTKNNKFWTRQSQNNQYIYLNPASRYSPKNKVDFETEFTQKSTSPKSENKGKAFRKKNKSVLLPRIIVSRTDNSPNQTIETQSSPKENRNFQPERTQLPPLSQMLHVGDNFDRVRSELKAKIDQIENQELQNIQIQFRARSSIFDSKGSENQQNSNFLLGSRVQSVFYQNPKPLKIFKSKIYQEYKEKGYQTPNLFGDYY